MSKIKAGVSMTVGALVALAFAGEGIALAAPLPNGADQNQTDAVTDETGTSNNGATIISIKEEATDDADQNTATSEVTSELEADPPPTPDGSTPLTAHPWGTSSWEIVDGILHIGPGELPATSESNPPPWYDHSSTITAVVFDDPVNTTFGASTSLLFFQLSNVVEIEGIGQVDTSNVRNMAFMFEGASSLTDLDISTWDTSQVTDMGAMFSEARSLVKLDLSGWDTGRVTDMFGMFSRTSSLTELDVSGWDTGQVTDMGSMFWDAAALTTVDVSGWDTSQVTDMEFMFSGARSLTTVDVSGWDTGRVTDMFGMFSRTSSLTNLDVSQWDTSQVANMGSMFWDAAALTTLDVSNWNTGRVADMYGVFWGASALTALDVSGWDTSNVENMELTFSGARSLTELDVSGWDTSRVTDMFGTFSGMRSLTELDVSGWDTDQVTDMGSMFSYASALGGLDISSWDTGNVIYMKDMFSGASSLAALSLGAHSSLSDDVALPEVPVSSPFTGVWQNIGDGTISQPTGKWTGTSAELVVLSRSEDAAGTYVWQQTSTVTTVTPLAPTREGSKVTIPTVEGVMYQNAGTGAVLTGTVTLVGGQTLKVKAIPETGYVFPKGVDTEWSFTYKADPTVPKPEPEKPSGNGTTGSGSGTGNNGGKGRLPVTGANIWLPMLVGIAVLGTGGVLVRRSRAS